MLSFCIFSGADSDNWRQNMKPLSPRSDRGGYRGARRGRGRGRGGRGVGSGRFGRSGSPEVLSGNFHGISSFFISRE